MSSDVDRIRDTRMKLLFLGLFVLSVVLAFLSVVFVFGFSMLGLWAGLGVAGGFGVALTWTYGRLRSTRKLRMSLRPGEVVCPQCQSLQTDLSEHVLEDGQIRTVWVCFACDHQWA